MATTSRFLKTNSSLSRTNFRLLPSPLHDTQEEKKEVDKEYNDKIKDFKATIADAVKSLKTRTTFTCEQCFQFIDYDEKKVGIYNRDGQLIEERPATLKELREPRNMFAETRKTGTDD